MKKAEYQSLKTEFMKEENPHTGKNYTEKEAKERIIKEYCENGYYI